MTRLNIYFDEGCGICKKVRRILKAFDFAGNCNFLFAKDMTFEESSEPMQNRYFDMYSFDGNVFYKGYDSYMQIFKRLHLFYPLYLMMKFSFVRKVGENYYRKFADSRTCKI